MIADLLSVMGRTVQKAKFKSKWTMIILMLAAFALCGCGTVSVKSSAKTYSIVSDEVYIYGEKLNGPGVNSASATLKLSKPVVEDGAEVDFDYFGRHYHGKIGGIYVLWDSKPEIVGGSTNGYCTISELRGSIYLTFHEYIGSKETWVEVKQTYTPN